MQYRKHAEERVTRGHGILEIFLAKQRASKANNLIPNSKQNGRILDIGCGSFPYFLNSINFKEKHGIDSSINQSMFKKSPIVIKNIDIEAKSFPYPNNFFDVVTMLAVFEHIDQKQLPFVLKEIHRILKTDGIFVITTPSPWASSALWLLSNIGLVSKIEIDDHKHSLQPNKIMEMLKDSRFSSIKNGFFELYFNMWFSAKK